MKHKNVYANAIAVVVYFLILLFFSWGESGGDIALIIYFLFLFTVHLLMALANIREKNSKQNFLGIFIGGCICLILFKSIEYCRYYTVPEAEIISVPLNSLK